MPEEKGTRIQILELWLETLKLLANSSCSYKIMDQSRLTIKKYLKDQKTRGATNHKNSQRSGSINDQFYEVDLVKSEIKQKKKDNCWTFDSAMWKIEKVGA